MRKITENVSTGNVLSDLSHLDPFPATERQPTKENKQNFRAQVRHLSAVLAEAPHTIASHLLPSADSDPTYDQWRLCYQTLEDLKSSNSLLSEIISKLHDSTFLAEDKRKFIAYELTPLITQIVFHPNESSPARNETRSSRTASYAATPTPIRRPSAADTDYDDVKIDEVKDSDDSPPSRPETPSGCCSHMRPVTAPSSSSFSSVEVSPPRPSTDTQVDYFSKLMESASQHAAFLSNLDDKGVEITFDLLLTAAIQNYLIPDTELNSTLLSKIIDQLNTNDFLNGQAVEKLKTKIENLKNSVTDRTPQQIREQIREQIRDLLERVIILAPLKGQEKKRAEKIRVILKNLSPAEADKNLLSQALASAGMIRAAKFYKNAAARGALQRHLLQGKQKTEDLFQSKEATVVYNPLESIEEKDSPLNKIIQQFNEQKNAAEPTLEDIIRAGKISVRNLQEILYLISDQRHAQFWGIQLWRLSAKTEEEAAKEALRRYRKQLTLSQQCGFYFCVISTVAAKALGSALLCYVFAHAVLSGSTAIPIHGLSPYLIVGLAIFLAVCNLLVCVHSRGKSMSNEWKKWFSNAFEKETGAARQDHQTRLIKNFLALFVFLSLIAAAVICPLFFGIHSIGFLNMSIMSAGLLIVGFVLSLSLFYAISRDKNNFFKLVGIIATIGAGATTFYGATTALMLFGMVPGVSLWLIAGIICLGAAVSFFFFQMENLQKQIVQFLDLVKKNKGNWLFWGVTLSLTLAIGLFTSFTILSGLSHLITAPGLLYGIGIPLIVCTVSTYIISNVLAICKSWDDKHPCMKDNGIISRLVRKPDQVTTHATDQGGFWFKSLNKKTMLYFGLLAVGDLLVYSIFGSVTAASGMASWLGMSSFIAIIVICAISIFVQSTMSITFTHRDKCWSDAANGLSLFGNRTLRSSAHNTELKATSAVSPAYERTGLSPA